MWGCGWMDGRRDGVRCMNGSNEWIDFMFTEIGLCRTVRSVIFGEKI